MAYKDLTLNFFPTKFWSLAEVENANYELHHNLFSFPRINIEKRTESKRSSQEIWRIMFSSSRLFWACFI